MGLCMKKMKDKIEHMNCISHEHNKGNKIIIKKDLRTYLLKII
jgi:hypothetical protein